MFPVVKSQNFTTSDHIWLQAGLRCSSSVHIWRKIRFKREDFLNFIVPIWKMTNPNRNISSMSKSNVTVYCNKRCRNKRRKGFSICKQLQTLPNHLLHIHKPFQKPLYIPQISLFQAFIRQISNPFIVRFLFRTFKVPLSPFYPIIPRTRQMVCKSRSAFY